MIDIVERLRSMSHIGMRPMILDAAADEIESLRSQLATALDWAADDQAIPEDAAILEAHPLETDRHDLYEKAMRLVGAKRSKGALVDLVNWLLADIDAMQPVIDAACAPWDFAYRRNLIAVVKKYNEGK